MTSHDQYFDYLRQRSRFGDFYRQHLLYPRLSKRLRGRALDIGCGIGDMLRHRPQTVGVDINERTIAYCRSLGLEAHRMDVDLLPFETGSFESVLMDNVLEHIEEPTKLLSEIHRVLASGGCLLVGVPGQRGWAADDDHKVFYDESALKHTLSCSGFAMQEVFYAPICKSTFLDRRMRQYCLYATFVRP